MHSVGSTIERPCFAKKKARGVEDMAPDVSEYELVQLLEERLVVEDREAIAEGDAGPKDAAYVARVQRCLERAKRRLPAPVLVNRKGHARRAAGGDHSLGQCHARGHRLLA